MHSRSQNFLQLLSAVSGNKGMRTNTHTRALAVYLIALSLFALTLSLLAEDTHWPLRIRGSVELHTEYNNGNLIVGFQPGRGPAGNGLQPGEASWLDRGFRPSEPHRLQQTISEDEATQLVTYLGNPDNYVTFYTALGGDGYFAVFSSEPYLQGQQTPAEPGRFIWKSSLNAPRSVSYEQGRPVRIEGGTKIIGGGRVVEHEHWAQKTEQRVEKENHHAEGRVHQAGGKEHVAVHMPHENEHIRKSGGGGHQVSLVKAVHRPLVRPVNRSVVKPAVAKANHQGGNPPKKKK
jgi:hypothetical protein